ncbi:tRNA (adenosine(37)-N6)-dimethylallyltransferase MiaA [Anaerotignum sp.]
MKRPLIVIGGPTACGKTGFSIKLAKKIGGEIISADSMQIYRYMDIGTAKVTPEEADGVPHYLIDELEPDEEYNVMLFQKKAKSYMEEIWAKGKIPILVGGTGFYINALLYDNDFTETENDTSYREKCYKLAREQGPEVLYERLKETDPEYAANIHANNVKRVTRALEYHYLTGQKFSEHNAEQKKKEMPYDAAVIILTMDREQLYERIELRIDKMVEQGLLEEVKGLLDRGYSPDLVSMQGIGYKEFIPYFNGECTLEEAITQLKTNTRHFAKRQLTWFRRQVDGLWIDLSKSTAGEALEDVLDYLKKKNILQTGDF